MNVQVQVAVPQMTEAAHFGAQRAHPWPHLLYEIVELAGWEGDVVLVNGAALAECTGDPLSNGPECLSLGQVPGDRTIDHDAIAHGGLQIRVELLA